MTLWCIWITPLKFENNPFFRCKFQVCHDWDPCIHFLSTSQIILEKTISHLLRGFESDTSNWSLLKCIYNVNNVIRNTTAKSNLKSAFSRTLIILICLIAQPLHFSNFDNTNNINHNSQQTHCQDLFLLSWTVLNTGTFPPRLSCNNWENNRRSTRALFIRDLSGDECVDSYLRICSGSSLSLNCEGKFKTGFTVKHWISAKNWLRVENCSYFWVICPRKHSETKLV